MNKRLRTSGKVILAIAGTLLAIILIILLKTMTYGFHKTGVQDGVKADIPTVTEKQVNRLSGGIRIPTVSSVDYSDTNFEPFDRFISYLRESYPEIYSVMETEVVNDYGLVFRWRGTDSSLKPLLLLSHYDVVPISGHDADDYEPQDSLYDYNSASPGPLTDYQNDWEHHPFSGAVTGDRIYGRGTLDMKGMLFSIMEAADVLISDGFTPVRDIYFAFGHDEEVGGLHGALKIAEHFRQQGIRFEAVYDEGSVIADSGIAGIKKPVALVGLGEKGFLTVRISVHGVGGHSSMPPSKGSLVLAAEIIERLNSQQLPAHLVPTISSFLDRVGGEMGFATRMAIANQWLFKPLLLSNLSKTPATNALVRTTTAITMAKGSEAPNVMSSVSEITANFRILPGDTVKDVMDHIEKICEGYDTSIEIVNSREPSEISSESALGFRMIERIVPDIYPDAIVASYITIGGTDSYKYQSVCDNIYRIMPIRLNVFEQRTIHNENEFISFENYGNMIYFFRRLMEGFGTTNE